MKHPVLAAHLTGRHAIASNLSDRQKELIRITRLIAGIDRKRNALKRQIKALTKERRARARGLRMLLIQPFPEMHID